MRLAHKVALIVLVVAFPALASAEPLSQLNPTDYVNDFSGVLGQQTQASLNDLCRQIDQKAGAQIAVVVINSLDGSDIESYTNALFRKWGVGRKSSNKGVLILLAVNDHKYRFEVGYGLEGILPDGKVGGFGREAIPFLRQGNYDGAVSLMVSRVVDVIAQDSGVQISDTHVPAPPASASDDGSVLAAVILTMVLLGGVGVYYLLRRALSGSGRRGGNGSGGNTGSWWWTNTGSGGFWDNSDSDGGFGGGGGFGGFGGGDSGGGGASGSW
jgi:uncharacterized protein